MACEAAYAWTEPRAKAWHGSLLRYKTSLLRTRPATGRGKGRITGICAGTEAEWPAGAITDGLAQARHLGLARHLMNCFDVLTGRKSLLFLAALSAC